MVKYLSIFVILALSGCATPDARIGQPFCDQPIPVNAEIWGPSRIGEAEDIPVLRATVINLRETMSSNQLTYEHCIDRLRERIRLHDEGIP